MRTLHPALLVLLAHLPSCGGVSSPAAPLAGNALVSTPEGSVGRIEVRQIDARPRLTLVSRDGDPTPAIVATVATDLDSVATTALATLVEARLRAAGFDVDVRIDRSAFRVRLLVRDPARIGPFIRALAAAYAQPIVAGAPELALAAERIQALRLSPLEAPELAPAAACTGRLGVAGGEPIVDLSTPAGVRELDLARSAALHAGHTSLAAVGPAAFCMAAARALEGTEGWPTGSPPADAWPAADAVGVYASNRLDSGDARVTVAVRIGSAQAAVAAAERLGGSSSPLRARLGALSAPFGVVEVVGVARPRGGCVSVTIEASGLPQVPSVETSAALAAALLRQEMRLSLSAPATPAVATRQILTARDPRDAGARASWWALSGNAADRQERWAVALGLPPSPNPPRPDSASAPGIGRAFETELVRALGPAARPIVERRTLIERGQGELWVLLASPCGMAEEGVYDAGSTALFALAAVRSARNGVDVTIEPWITPDAVGIIAHAPLRDVGETAVELGRRVAEVAARTFAATTIDPESLRLARTTALQTLDQLASGHAVMLDAFASAVVPDHPSWVEPLGIWDRVASIAPETVQLRWQALAEGPLRVAVLANADAAQAAAAADAVERWLPPRLTTRACGAPQATLSPRAGQRDLALPEAAPEARALVGARLPPAGFDLGQVTVAALNGSDGLLAAALGVPAGVQAAAAPIRPLSARAAARLLGGARAAALVVEIKAAPAEIDEATARVKALLTELGQRATDADLARASGQLAKRDREALADPRRRLINLWLGRADGTPPRSPSLSGWRAWLSGALAAPAIVTVEARPE